MKLLELLVKLVSLFSKKKEESYGPIIGEKEREKVLMDLAPKKKIIHINCDGPCPKCEEIFNQYPDFNKELKDWFNAFRLKNKDAHIAYAGRGKKEQDKFYELGTSKAKFGQSPHNYGLAIDIFRLTINGAEFSVDWYSRVVNPEVKASGFLVHGGDWKSFKDWPHVELKNYKELITQGKVKLVE